MQLCPVCKHSFQKVWKETCTWSRLSANFLILFSSLSRYKYPNLVLSSNDALIKVTVLPLTYAGMHLLSAPEQIQYWLMLRDKVQGMVYICHAWVYYKENTFVGIKASGLF